MPSAPPETSLEAPSGASYFDFVRQWSDEHVTRWLTESKCAPAVADLFRENDIRGDILLELDQATLKEIGVTSVGDRLRILSAVKSLRLKCSGGQGPGNRPISITTPPIVKLTPSDTHHSPSSSSPENGSPSTSKHPRHKNIPPPITLPPSSPDSNLPRIVRPPDSARGLQPSSRPIPVRSNSKDRGLPPVPPAPRTQPPPPPTSSRQNGLHPNNITRARTPDPPGGTGSTPPNGSRWMYGGLPSNPSPGNLAGGSYAPGSPLVASNRIPQTPTSIKSNSPAQLLPIGAKTPQRPSGASGQYVLALPNNPPKNLSPIFEPTSPTAPTYMGRAPQQAVPARPMTPTYGSSDKVLTKFFFENGSRVVDVTDCETGADILERALKKFNKHSQERDHDIRETDDGGLIFDGWGIVREEDLNQGRSHYYPQMTFHLKTFQVDLSPNTKYSKSATTVAKCVSCLLSVSLPGAKIWEITLVLLSQRAPLVTRFHQKTTGNQSAQRKRTPELAPTSSCTVLEPPPDHRQLRPVVRVSL